MSKLFNTYAEGMKFNAGTVLALGGIVLAATGLGMLPLINPGTVALAGKGGAVAEFIGATIPSLSTGTALASGGAVAGGLALSAS